MKKHILAFFLSMPLLGASQEILTNADVVKLTKLELPASTIVSKIHNSRSRFDVSVDALVALKGHGVSGEVVNEMIAADAKEQQIISACKNYRNPRTMRKEGIYYYNPSDSANPLSIVDPSVNNYKTQSIGASLGQVYSMGLVKNKQHSAIVGAHARRSFAQTKPVFYFYLDAAKGTTPSEFALVKLTEKADSREMIVGKANVYSSTFGVDPKESIEIQYELVAEGIYKVYPKSGLTSGEYCFVYTSSAPTSFSNAKAYDFQIAERQK